jgi:hypothetical protein
MMGVEPVDKLFGDRFSPQKIEANVENLGIKKARAPQQASLLQAFLAGLFFCIVRPMPRLNLRRSASLVVWYLHLGLASSR